MIDFVRNTNDLDFAVSNQDARRAGDILYEQFGPGKLPHLKCLLGLLPVNEEHVREQLFDPVALDVWLDWHVCALLPWIFKFTTGIKPDTPQSRQFRPLIRIENVLLRELRTYMDVDKLSTQGQTIRTLVVLEDKGAPYWQPWLLDAILCVALNEHAVVGHLRTSAVMKAERRAINRLSNRLKNLALQLHDLVPSEPVRKFFPADERNPYV